MSTDGEKAMNEKKRRVVSVAKRPELRLRLEDKDQALLSELTLHMDVPAVEATRRAIRNEVERIREGMKESQLSTIRTNIVSLQEQVTYLGRRVEASIEINRSIEKRILDSLDDIEKISSMTGYRVHAMIESQTSDRAAAVRAKLQELLGS